jgi:hypothetical protein
MLKINLRLQAVVGQLTNQVNAAQGQVAAANVIARQVRLPLRVLKRGSFQTCSASEVWG